MIFPISFFLAFSGNSFFLEFLQNRTFCGASGAIKPSATRLFWEFSTLKVVNLVVCNFYAEALFCALLCPFGLFCALAFPLFCGHLRSFAFLLRVFFANDRIYKGAITSFSLFNWEPGNGGLWKGGVGDNVPVPRVLPYQMPFVGRRVTETMLLLHCPLFAPQYRKDGDW